MSEQRFPSAGVPRSSLGKQKKSFAPNTASEDSSSSANMFRKMSSAYCSLAACSFLPVVIIGVSSICFAFGLPGESNRSWSPLHLVHSIQKLTLDYHLLRTDFYAVEPTGLTADELSGKTFCSFHTEYGLPYSCKDELAEYRIAHEVIHPNASVLEIGGKFGTISCEIAKIQGNSGKLAVAEADQALWSVLHGNQLSHQCSFTVILGTVGSRDIFLVTDGNGRKLFKSRDVDAVANEVETNIYRISLEELEARMRYRFDTIFIHCGSCVEHFIADNFSSLEVIRTIVIESDQDIENESSCDQQKTCRNLRFWIEKLENELRFKRGEIKREQSYIMQIIPGDILYHYVLIKK